MKTVWQLFRQPLKTFVGVILIALAVAILGVCLGQALMARKTVERLEYDFTTIALPTGNYNVKYSTRYPGSLVYINSMNEEVEAWVEQVIEENPELVVGRSYTGLASAYLPELAADNYTSYDSLVYRAGKAPQTQLVTIQDCAMFVVTLEVIGEPEPMVYNRTLNEPDPATGEDVHIAVTEKVQIVLQARIDQVLCLAENQTAPTGWPIELTLEVGSMEEWEDLELEVGKQYIVNGIDYFDNSIYLGQYIQLTLELNGKSLAAYDKNCIHIVTEEENEMWMKIYSYPLLAVYSDVCDLSDGLEKWFDPYTGELTIRSQSVLIFGQDSPGMKPFEQYHTAKMTLRDAASLPKFSYDDGSILHTRTVSVDGEEQIISWEEYKALYSMPTIAPLEGSVEEFLAENQFWSDWLSYQQINTHAFPVFAVEKLDYIADFNRGLTRITQGREFTQEEMESGAKVCVISETLAQINGLTVGDTISPQFYDFDINTPYGIFVSDNSAGLNTSSLANPYHFNETTGFAGEVEKYTIVGIYRQNQIWQNIEENVYAFTPNTIFVPKESVDAPLDYSELGLFNVLVLKNGTYTEFDKILLDKEFETMSLPKGGEEEMFIYCDQGYMAMSENVMDFAELAQQVLIVGIVVYGIVLVLFLLLYPGRQGKNLRTMANFGTPRKDKIAHVLVSSLGILLPGTILGSLLAMILWGVVVGRLLTVSGAMFSLTLDLGTLALIALAQLLLALALTLLLAIPMTKHENLMKRK